MGGRGAACRLCGIPRDGARAVRCPPLPPRRRLNDAVILRPCGGAGVQGRTAEARRLTKVGEKPPEAAAGGGLAGSIPRDPERGLWPLGPILPARPSRDGHICARRPPRPS